MAHELDMQADEQNMQPDERACEAADVDQACRSAGATHSSAQAVDQGSHEREDRATMGLASSIRPGADANADARAKRRSIRERLNDHASRRLLLGMLVTLTGGIFWGFSGTSASFLFDRYHVDTLWLLSTRQLLAGILFMAMILLFDRDRFIQLLKTPKHLAVMFVFTFVGVCANSMFYLLAVRYTNAGTATVMQCLQLVIIMGYTCIRAHRAPRRRELAGLVLAFLGAFLIATGGDPTSLIIPPEGLVVGLLSAVGAACMSIVPTKILPIYGSSIVTGSAIFTSGLVLSAVIQPWNSVPPLDLPGWGALAVLVVVGTFLAYNLYMQGVKEVGSVRASLIGTIEPVSATVTSALVLGTLFAPTDIIGFACIIVMVFLTV